MLSLSDNLIDLQETIGKIVEGAIIYHSSDCREGSDEDVARQEGHATMLLFYIHVAEAHIGSGHAGRHFIAKFHQWRNDLEG